MTTVLTPQMKERIAEEIREIDAVIDEAIRLINEKKFAEAQEKIAEAMERKRQRLAYGFPAVNVDGEGRELPFFTIYDLFSDIDQAAVEGHGAMTLFGKAEGADRAKIQEVIARLRVLLDELERSLLNIPWFDDEAIDKLENLRDRVRAMIDALENFLRTGLMEVGSFRGVQDLKRSFLEWVSDSIDLWAVYTLLNGMDISLTIAYSTITRHEGPQGVELRNTVDRLRHAIRLKHKLQALVEGTPPREPVQPPGLGPVAPPRNEAPEPDWPRGMEDLPPFPPDHA